METNNVFTGGSGAGVGMVSEHRGDHPSEWAAICSIAEKFGCSSETLL